MSRGDKWLGFSGIAITISIFLIDLVVPAGIVMGILYAVPIVMTIWSRAIWPLYLQFIMALCFVWLDYIFGTSGVQTFFVITNRIVSTTILLIIGIIVYLYKNLKLRNESLIQKSLELFRAALDAAPEGMILIQENGTVKWANQSAEKLFGQELIFTHIENLMPAVYREKCLTHFRQAMDNVGNTVRIRELDAAILAKGKEIPVICRMSRLELDEPVVICALIDLSHRKEMENRLRATQKMESIGKLAGGIAHDFNNLLTAIINYTQFVQESLPSENPVHDDLREVQNAAYRAASLTKQLLAFSRKQIIAPKILQINEIIKDMTRMLTRLLGEDIEIQTYLADGCWLVEIDPSQFEQVLLNLAVNARDAMPKGGTLLIETLNVTLDEEYCREHPDVHPGEFAMLAITDTGIGMTQEIRARIFEPFFTTKGVNVGTGMGLSTVYGIVKQASGHIWPYSEPGQGATFKVYLPKAKAEFAEQEQRVLRKPTQGGSETILLVEDEIPLRNLMVRVLRKAGYEVIEAGNGQEAILRLKEQDKLDLVITDVVMPQIGGKELIQKLTSSGRYPDMKILYITGYTENAIVTRGVLYEGIILLQKPFTMADFLIRVREVLDLKYL